MYTRYLSIRLPGLDQVAMKVYAYCGVWKLWSCGYYFIVHLPSSVLCFCWRTQLYVICFPFTITKRTFVRIRKLLSGVLSVVTKRRRNTKEVLRDFLECELDETKGVLDSIHNLQWSSLAASTRVSDVRRRIQTCRCVLEELRSKTNSHDGSSDEQISQMNNVLCSVVEMLRNYPEDDPECWKKCDPVSNGIEPLKSLIIRPDLDDDGLFHESIYNSIIESRNKSLGYDRFEQTCLHHPECVNPDQPKYLGNHQQTSIDHDQSDRNGYCQLGYTSLDENENESNLLNLSIVVSDKVIGLLNDENKKLMDSLTGTKGELDSTRHKLHTLNEKVSNLEYLLDVIRERLSRTEAERDVMRDKLLQLDSMIEEQEVFLFEDPYDVDDHYSKLSLNPRRMSFQ